ncbi:hypothetical protein [Candidatus Pantoea soli]|uniref:Uncharacterized protein n=1 Tax=Candidatus Pantoea soli TaxID=3098669 RepID=A0A518XDF7_9GAMM|nr:hypothetical protein [Pantoea soli]QDY42242.1 hypothetical protein D8B20_10205 [Pantoea soli]
MKWILFLGLLLSGVSLADDRSFETPEAKCLNDHTIPFIETDIPPKKVVDEAYIICKPELDEWKKSQEVLPDEMKQRMRKELYDFYIRMIDIRRKYEAKKTAEAAH